MVEKTEEATVSQDRTIAYAEAVDEATLGRTVLRLMGIWLVAAGLSEVLSAISLTLFSAMETGDFSSGTLVWAAMSGGQVGGGVLLLLCSGWTARHLNLGLNVGEPRLRHLLRIGITLIGIYWIASGASEWAAAFLARRASEAERLTTYGVSETAEPWLTAYSYPLAYLGVGLALTLLARQITLLLLPRRAVGSQ